MNARFIAATGGERSEHGMPRRIPSFQSICPPSKQLFRKGAPTSRKTWIDIFGEASRLCRCSEQNLRNERHCGKVTA